MNLSERKAQETFRPWWDVFCRYCTIAALALCVVLFFSVSRSEKEIIVEESDDDGIDEAGLALDPMDEDYFGESSSPDGGGGTVSAAGGDSSSAGGVDGGGVLEEGGEGDVNGSISAARDVTDSLLRIKQDLLADLTGHVSVRRTTTISSDSAFHAVFVLLALAASGVLLLLDLAFSRIFYSHHLLQVSCQVLEALSSVSPEDCGRRSGGGRKLLLSSTLHHSNDKRSLRHTLDVFNLVRFVLSLVFFILAVHAVAGVERSKSGEQAQYILGILLSAVLSLLTALSGYGAAWPWVNSRTLWGRLMATYARTVDKLDVARGRSVPSPPYSAAASSGGTKSRVLESLNPYASNANLRLVLDLVALRSGVGLALRCLAFMESDVGKNWRPFRLQAKMEKEGKSDGDDARRSLSVAWRDPLAVLYLAPVPRELQLHFCVEISFPEGSGVDPVVEVVGYDDMRYYRRMWRSAEPGSVHIGGGGGVERGAKEGALSYVEVFPDFPGGIPFNVDVWTMIDGQLVAKSYVVCSDGGGGDCEDYWDAECRQPPRPTPNQIPKPPRKKEDVAIVVDPPSEEEDDGDAEEEGDEEEEEGVRLSVPQRGGKQLVLTPAASSVFDFKEEEEGEDEEGLGSAADSEEGGHSDYEEGKKMGGKGSSNRARSLSNLREVEKKAARMKKSRSYGARMHQRGSSSEQQQQQQHDKLRILAEVERGASSGNEEGEDIATKFRKRREKKRREEQEEKNRRKKEEEEEEEEDQGVDNEGYECHEEEEEEEELYVI